MRQKRRMRRLNGFYVNLEYPLPNGQSVKLLEDNKVYLGNQIEIQGSSRCYGIVRTRNIFLFVNMDVEELILRLLYIRGGRHRTLCVKS